MNLDPNTIESILRTIDGLSVKATLAYLSKEFHICDLAKNGLESIKDAIIRKTKTSKFGFVPNKEESNFLLRVSKEKQGYKEFTRILPKNHYSDYIRVGYLISNLNKIGNKTEKVEKIREGISLRPNGAFLIKVVNLVTTGSIVPILDYLDELRRKNYDSNYLEHSFSDIISEWARYTIFIERTKTELEVYEEVKTRLQQRQKLVMVFAYGSAELTTVVAMARIIKESAHSGYFYSSKNTVEGDKPVHSSSFMLLDLA